MCTHPSQYNRIVVHAHFLHHSDARYQSECDRDGRKTQHHDRDGQDSRPAVLHRDSHRVCHFLTVRVLVATLTVDQVGSSVKQQIVVAIVLRLLLLMTTNIVEDCRCGEAVSGDHDEGKMERRWLIQKLRERLTMTDCELAGDLRKEKFGCRIAFSGSIGQQQPYGQRYGSSQPGRLDQFIFCGDLSRFSVRN